MKLSTIMLMVSIALFMCVLVVYNLSLKAAYLKGTFRERFGEHTFKPLKAVTQLRLGAANMMGTSIEYGEREGVWISNHVKDFVKVDQDGGLATISLVNATKDNYGHIGTGDVVILVNKLNKVRTGTYVIKGQRVEDYGSELNIINLKGDTLDIETGEQSSVFVNGCNYKVFNAVVGGDKYWSRLSVSGNNKFGSAYFDVRKSSLELQNPSIVVLNYKLTDSSRVELWGRSAKRLLN